MSYSSCFLLSKYLENIQMPRKPQKLYLFFYGTISFPSTHPSPFIWKCIVHRIQSHHQLRHNKALLSFFWKVSGTCNFIKASLLLYSVEFQHQIPVQVAHPCPELSFSFNLTAERVQTDQNLGHKTDSQSICSWKALYASRARSTHAPTSLFNICTSSQQQLGLPSHLCQ